MKRRVFALVAGVTSLMIIMSGPALAIPIPGTQDQHQDNSGGTSTSISGAVQAAQTFTAGMSGNLVAVEIYVNLIDAIPTVARPNVLDGATVEIRTTSSNVPTSTVLASESVVLSADMWNGIIFSSPAAITSGTKYALVVYPDSGQFFQWGGTCTAGDYTGGAAMINSDSSWDSVATFDDGSCIEHWAFRTFVSVNTPPPTTAVASSSTESNGTALPLLLAGAFAAIAYVTVRRLHFGRR